MSEIKAAYSIPDPSTVVCQSCGAPIGCYTERDGKVQLQVGALIVDWAHGVCQCGEPFHWRSHDWTLNHLVNRVLEIRKKGYGTIPQNVIRFT
jgi:hypothetical protein